MARQNAQWTRIAVARRMVRRYAAVWPLLQDVSPDLAYTLARCACRWAVVLADAGCTE